MDGHRFVMKRTCHPSCASYLNAFDLLQAFLKTFHRIGLSSTRFPSNEHIMTAHSKIHNTNLVFIQNMQIPNKIYIRLFIILILCKQSCKHNVQYNILWIGYFWYTYRENYKKACCKIYVWKGLSM